MAGRIERVVPGPIAEASLAAAVGRLKGADRLAPVFVVVRSPIVGLWLRRRLAADGAFAAVRFAPLGALVQRLGGADRATAGREPLSPVALRAAARVALDDVAGVLGPVAAHPATEASLGATYRDLRRLSAQDLDQLARASERAHDVVRLVGRMRATLEATTFDALDVLEVATGRLDAGASDLGPELAELGGIVVYLPDPLTQQEIGLLACLARHLEVHVLAGQCGDEMADRALDHFAEELGSAGFTMSVEAAAKRASGVAAGGVLSAPDDDVEVREAVRRLIAHAEAGGDLGRCIVSYPDGERSAELGRRVSQQLRFAGIPCSRTVSERLRDTPHAQLLLGLVQLSLPVPPGQELDRGAVMEWLGRGPVRSGWPASEVATGGAVSGVPIGEWDRLTRSAGVLSGISAWRQRLELRLQRLQDHQSSEARLRATQDVAVFIERLHALMSAASTAQSWTVFHAWADTALEELLSPSPETELLAEALFDLDLLDRIEPLGHRSPSERLRRFAAALDVVFDRPSSNRGRYGVGPTVGPLSTVAGASSELLLVLGCCERELPAHAVEDPLVPRIEREQIEGLAERERADERARRQLASLLLASESAHASFSRIDVRAGRLVHPSRWASELFVGRRTDVPSFSGSVRRVVDGVAPATDSTDFELASLAEAAVESGRSDRSDRWLERLEPDFARCRESVARRHQHGLNAFAGYVPAAGAGPDAWSAVMSATPLQNFAECPFRFFVQRKLNVSVVEAPERRIQIDPRDRGSLMHAVLEGFFRPSDEPWTLTIFDRAQLRRLRSIADEQFRHFEALGKTGKALFWVTERTRILRDLERYVARDVASSASAGLVPVAVELAFGRDGSPLVLTAAGREVSFSGFIDRVDRAPSGSLVVIDYKSGSSFGYKDIETEPLGRGRHLQLPIYAKAAQQALGSPTGEAPPVRAEYRFVQAASGYAIVPVELSAAVDAELSDVLETLVSTVDAGCFPPRPGRPVKIAQHEHCQYCDFDALCTIDRAELWEHACTDPRIKPYADLVDGTPGDGSSDEAGK
jgi:RecB family exonuclease